jgi:hypothetical protein
MVMSLAVASCGLTPQGTAIKAAVKKGAATVSKTVVEEAEETLCRRARVGAIKDRYRGADMDRYNEFCEIRAGGGRIAPHLETPK